MQVWQLIHTLQQNPLLLLIMVGVLGLCVGSFLNVLIYRTPTIMMHQWRLGSVQILQSQPDIPTQLLHPITQIVQQDPPLSLAYPRSHCPHCNHLIHWYHNFPLISWICLLGNCSHCQQKIHWRYPLVELSTALLSILVVSQLGLTLQGMFALLFVWTLIALAGIDFNSQYLPDKLTFPLMGLGLAVNSYALFVAPFEAIWGMLLGYLSLWLVVKIFYIFTKKQGMGQGDFKLLAVLGAWLGPWQLPLIILLSSLLGSIIGIILRCKRAESRPFAFGPYLAIAGILALLYGRSLMQWYLNLG